MIARLARVYMWGVLALLFVVKAEQLLGGHFMLRTFFFDRRLWLLLLLTVLVVALGRYAVPLGTSLKLVVKGGYWFMLFTFCLWAWCLWRLALRDKWSWPRAWLSWLPVFMAAVGGLLWQAHETHGFKILADESLLVGTAQNMHLDREIGYPVRSTDVQGPFQILHSLLDKRPYFYPFLVSLIHDLTGYRTENAFWFNTGLSFVFLGLLFALCAKAAASRRAGFLALILAIGLPLLAQQAAGAGFELLNLTLAVGWWWLAIRFTESPDADVQDTFVLTAVLLASTRYESLLFFVPTALILLATWWRGGAVRCTWATWIAPLLLLPMFWLNRAFTANDKLWELETLGAKSPFSIEYFASNLGHALKYFFTLDGYQPNSPYLALLGLLALPFFLLWAQRIWRTPQAAKGELGLALGALGPLAVTGLLMVYFWGQFDHPVIARLSLPTQLLMVVATVVVLERVFGAGHRVWGGVIAGALIALFAHSLPVMSKNAYGRDYSPGMAFAWRREFLAEHPERDYLILDRDSQMWIAEKVTATPILQAKTRREGIAYHMRNHSFSAVYVFQTFKVNPDTGELTVDPEDDLGPNFELEQVAQRRVHLLSIARFSRVVAIRDGGKVLAEAEPAARITHPEATPTEIEAGKKSYMDRWVSELP